MRVFLRYAGNFANIFLIAEKLSNFDFFQETETGLYISLTTFFGFGKDHVERYYQKTKHAVFLHIQRVKTEVNFLFEVIGQ